MKIEYFDSVWDAIESTPAEAANMKARSSLMTASSAALKIRITALRRMRAISC